MPTSLPAGFLRVESLAVVVAYAAGPRVVNYPAGFKDTHLNRV